ncbi:MAG: 50S ribosomal protein L19 [candidate division WOR-3 bacterium]
MKYKFIDEQLKKDIPDFRAGDMVRVTEILRENDKERLHNFEGIVIARKHGRGINATFSVRGEVLGYGVEKTYPLHSPLISKIEVLKSFKVRRSKLYYLRKAQGKRIRLKARP